MTYPETTETFKALWDKAPSDVAQRAERYVSLGKVKNLTLDAEGVLRAEVEGNGDAPYKVKVDAQKRVRSCSCPAHKYHKGPCKHVLAALKPFVSN